MTLDEMREALEELMDQLPDEIFRELNGGVLVLPDVKVNPVGQGLYILGEYHYQPLGLGRYISIYHGSLQRAMPHLSDEGMRAKLREVLHHELTHHVEHLAGDRSLEHWDAKQQAKYLEALQRRKEYK